MPPRPLRASLTHPLKACTAIGCSRLIKPRLLMCREHWQKVPREIQERVYLTLDDWKHGASVRTYCIAVAEATLVVAHAEGQPAESIAPLLSKFLQLTERAFPPLKKGTQ